MKKLPKKVSRWPHLELVEVRFSYLHFDSSSPEKSKYRRDDQLQSVGLLREIEGEECLINDQAFMLGLKRIKAFAEWGSFIAAMLIDSDLMQFIS